jgi:hypothetical protein
MTQTPNFEPTDKWQECCDKLLFAVKALHERLDEMEQQWEDRWSRRHEP